jgi:chemotaxis protein methyltransferase CheR
MPYSTISLEEYNAFRSFLERASGIVLGENKHYLVTSRLSRLMLEFSIKSFSELMSNIEADRLLRQHIMDAMTTNETSWFRDIYPYEILKEKLLPDLAQRKLKRIKIWSTACSSGQEPYSMSMVVSEYLTQRPGSLPVDGFEIIGTDISSTIMQQAKLGCYDGMSIARGLSEERQKRFFRQNNNSWHVIDEIKDRVTFREMNLMQNYTLMGKYDIIFCRNVLIYFSTELKKDIMRRLAQALNPGGILILGGSESISGYSDDFELLRWKSGVVYILKENKYKRQNVF